MITITFTIIKKTIGLRVTKEEEILGLDVEEHGLTSAYADFMPTVDMITEVKKTSSVAPVEKAVPVSKVGYTPSSDGTKLTKVVIVAKQNKFEELKQAMNAIGVTGMTVTNVLGCGVQKGATEYYRGVPLEMNLLPKVQVEIVVCKVPVETVIEEAKKALYTGNIGDGKIFVYDVENVIKVRTGEVGCDALQDED